MKYSVPVRNARIDAVVAAIGASPVLRIFSGAMPVNCAAADPAGKLVEIALPAVWMNAAAGGVATFAGVWSGAGIVLGNALSFRIYDNALAACHIQGTITATGGGGDMTLDNVSIAAAEPVKVTKFTINGGNA